MCAFNDQIAGRSSAAAAEDNSCGIVASTTKILSMPQPCIPTPLNQSQSEKSGLHATPLITVISTPGAKYPFKFWGVLLKALPSEVQ